MTGSRNKKDIILSLYQQSLTVFRTVDVAMLIGETDRASLAKKLNYHVGKGRLRNPRKGIYTKPEYNPVELACRIYAPSYISLNYALQKAGIVFQYDSAFTLVSYLSRTLEIDKFTFRYRKLKDPILANPAGIDRQPNQVNIAQAERAFLDMLYLNPGFYFDQPGSLNPEKVTALFPVYKSKALEKRAAEILRNV
jgi:hypothetical protein